MGSWFWMIWVCHSVVLTGRTESKSNSVVLDASPGSSKMRDSMREAKEVAVGVATPTVSSAVVAEARPSALAEVPGGSTVSPAAVDEALSTALAVPAPSPAPVREALSACKDNHAECGAWAARGDCETNPSFMLSACGLSCDNDACRISAAAIARAEALAAARARQRDLLVTHTSSYHLSYVLISLFIFGMVVLSTEAMEKTHVDCALPASKSKAYFDCVAVPLINPATEVDADDGSVAY